MYWTGLDFTEIDKSFPKYCVKDLTEVLKLNINIVLNA